MTVLFVSSIIFLVFRNSVLVLFLGWDGLGVPSFFLIIFYSNWKRISNRVVTIIRNRFGDGVLLLGFSYMLASLLKELEALSFIPFLLLFIVRVTKRAQFPFSS